MRVSSTVRSDSTFFCSRCVGGRDERRRGGDDRTAGFGKLGGKRHGRNMDIGDPAQAVGKVREREPRGHGGDHGHRGNGAERQEQARPDTDAGSRRHCAAPAGARPSRNAACASAISSASCKSRETAASPLGLERGLPFGDRPPRLLAHEDRREGRIGRLRGRNRNAGCQFTRAFDRGADFGVVGPAQPFLGAVNGRPDRVQSAGPGR